MRAPISIAGRLTGFPITVYGERAQGCRDLVEAIFGRFLQFDLRNGSIRKKFDSLKYMLKTLERTLYELSLTPVAQPSPAPVSSWSASATQNAAPWFACVLQICNDNT